MQLRLWILKSLFICFIILGLCKNNAAGDTDSRGYQKRYAGYQQDQGNNPFGVYWREAKPEDYIYLLPAHGGATLFMGIGNVVCWAPKTIYYLSQGDDSMEAFLPPVAFSNKYFGMPGAYILGSPFWCLKKAFWDGPVWLYNAVAGEDEEPCEAPTPELKKEPAATPTK